MEAQPVILVLLTGTWKQHHVVCEVIIVGVSVSAQCVKGTIYHSEANGRVNLDGAGQSDAGSNSTNVCFILCFWTDHRGKPHLCTHTQSTSGLNSQTSHHTAAAHNVTHVGVYWALLGPANFSSIQSCVDFRAKINKQQWNQPWPNTAY